MAKGAPPPFMRGKAAGPSPAAQLGRTAAMTQRPAPPPPQRRPPPMPPPTMGGGPPPDMGPPPGAPPAFKKGGKVGGSFPKGKQAKMPR